eukprot:CAMPEP_0182580644 /NCGR_PEP_ID=MMETSP1324-20130603/47691_1 /TAXON_ID=236786 /ORGANISM="Florenciella sp., Strain RCC1587" /LENGTH=36 /DNA_ID= /DNA_START= /DNA_END= /DNA_ORIENTATION=
MTMLSAYSLSPLTAKNARTSFLACLAVALASAEGRR